MNIAASHGMTRMGPRLRVFYPDNPQGVFTIRAVARGHRRP
jgi:hypothetical protein